MKKIIAALLIGILCVISLCSCGINEVPASLEDSMEIPENGIISESIFKSLKDENKVIVFKGKNNAIEYEWTVFGKDIEEPKDTNLSVEILEDKIDSLSFQLSSKEDLSFGATLAIHSANLWTAENAQLFFADQTDKEAVANVSITGEKSSVLNMAVQKTGTYKVLPLKQQSETKKDGTSNSTEAKKTGNATDESGRALSDGTQTGQDAYLTDPVPEGKPLPVEPSEKETEASAEPIPVAHYCTISIECSTILNNLDMLEPSKLDCVPGDGYILYPVTVEFYDGESVFDVLQRTCNYYGIHMEASWTPMYNSAYVEGIGNLYEFDCGSGSGWMYRVNWWYPNYGCSRYQLADGDYIEWRYTCDLGADVGGGYAVGN